MAARAARHRPLPAPGGAYRAKEIALRKELKLHEYYETFVMVPGQPTQVILKEINAAVQRYNEKTLANDIAVDTPGFMTTLTCQPRGLP